ncbi:MAG: HlyD family efflux transporter periplasmic adaptor subunit [Holophagales bacterium]|nr:HlyD family efflux transporter periplasmic adaptor subunit [Holophagales bacterium]
MPIPFAQTTRALRADRFGRSGWTLALTSAFLAVWAGWFWTARLSVVVRAEEARLETAVHAVQSSLSGRVAEVHLRLGERVAIGAPFLTLDAEKVRLERQEAMARHEALEARLAALRSERARAREALRHADDARAAGLEIARAQSVAIGSAARQASAEAARLRQLFEREMVSRADFERAFAKAEQERATAFAQEQLLLRTGSLRRRDLVDRQVGLDRLDGEIASLDGERAIVAASLARLDHEMTRHLVRAPVAGRVADLAPVRAGAFVEAGDRIGAIVPEAALHAVAHLPASDATGRLRPGQTAGMRLDSFPWTQFGVVAATVERVATDGSEGRVRVELRIDAASVPAVPLQHGLTGSVEIEIERVAPAVLVLRQAVGLVPR